LFLENVDLSYAGEYQCVAENDYEAGKDWNAIHYTLTKYQCNIKLFNRDVFLSFSVLKDKNMTNFMEQSLFLKIC
jgi:hypothetical protein